MADLSQQGRLLQLLSGGPIDPAEGVATRLVGAEGLSRPFRFTVDLLAKKAQIPPVDVLGRKLGVMLFGHEQSPDVHTVRLVHGHVGRWTELGAVGTGADRLTHYQAELVPWLALLSLSAKTRTYEEKAVDEIVSDVFDKAGFKNRYRFRLTRTPLPKRPYVVQYAESDLAFVSRLLEEEGLYYRFDHHSDEHFLEISDKHGNGVPQGIVDEMKLSPIQRKAPIENVPVIGLLAGLLGNKTARGGADKGVGEAASLGGAAVGSLLGPLGIAGIAASGATAGISALGGMLLDFLFTPTDIVPGNAVTELRRDRAVHTETASVRDFHLLRPAQTGMEITSGPGARGEYFAFLGDLAGTPEAGVSEAEAARRMREIEAGREVFHGATTNVALQPGTRVKMTGGLLGKTPVEVHVLEVGTAGQVANPNSVDDSKVIRYVNEFTAIPVATPFVPALATARPSVRGTQTAEVVGVGGAGAIDVDEHGRVLLMFPWDEGAGAERKSKHRVHVATTWAGVGWGAVQWPRVGQLVLVEFLEGDPARPIVTGRVYSRQHPFPYAMPANKTQSGMKSRTLDGTDQNFNELRFEDKKGSEHVFLQAEKDLTENVKHDRVATIQHHDHHLVDGGDGDKQGEQKLRVDKGNQYLLVLEGEQFMENKKGNQAVYALDGKQMFRIDKGPQDFLVSDGNRTVTVEKGNNTKDISGTDATSADTITLTAQTKIELKVGGSTVTLTPTGIEIKTGASKIALGPAGVKTEGAQVETAAQAMAKIAGPMVEVNGSAMAAVKGPMVQVNGSAMLMAKGGVTMVG